MTVLGTSISPELSLSRGKKIGFHFEPNCIRHLAAQREVTHAILSYKEVGGGRGEGEKKTVVGEQAGGLCGPRQKDRQPEWRAGAGPVPWYLSSAPPALGLLSGPLAPGTANLRRGRF